MLLVFALIATLLAVVALCCCFYYYYYYNRHVQRERFVVDIKCKVINLERNTDRWKHFSAGFNASDSMRHLDLERIEAVDGALAFSQPNESRIPLDVHDKLMQTESSRQRIYHHQLTKGAVGCYLSHIRIFEALLRDNSCDFYVIFEDDALIPSNDVPDLGGIVQSAPADWDILVLGYFRKTPHLDESNNDAAFVRVVHFWGLHAYVINKTGAAKIIAEWRKSGLTMQIDSVMSVMASFDALNIYASRNIIFYTSNFGSDIQLPIMENNAAIDPFFIPGFNYTDYPKIL
jgi:GR25 family glycosyltransferase involved in LPS biosynthesis